MDMTAERFVATRLHPLRVTLRLLDRELELAKGEEVPLPRELLESVTRTLELFIGDFDVNFGTAAARTGKEKKFVEPPKGAVKV